MRYVISVFLVVLSFVFAISAQNRQEAIGKFEKLVEQGKVLEKIIVSPAKEDIEAAKQQNVSVVRILPREIYDKGLLTTRGGNAYYSFYFKIHDWGHGSDIGLEQNYLSVGLTGLGFMADLGSVPLSEVSRGTQSVNSLINYQGVKSGEAYRDFGTLRSSGLKLDETLFKTRLQPTVGHTYVARSVTFDYYDILVAFKIHRQDTDGSLIIFWKQIEQFETPYRNNNQKAQTTDVEILKQTQSWQRPGMFPNVQVEANNAVVTLRGSIPKDKLAYAVQLANNAGAVKVVNLLSLE